MMLGLLWASAFPLAKIATHGLPVFTIVAIRLVTAAALLMAIRAAVTGKWLSYPPGSLWPMTVLACIGNNIPFVLLTLGLTTLKSGEAALLIALAPLFGMLMAAAVLSDEPLSRKRIAGTLMGFAGAALVIAPQLSGKSPHAPWWAYACLVATAASYGAVHVAAKHYSRYPALDRATGSMILSALFSLPPVLFEQPWALPAFPSSSVFASLALGVFPSALAGLLFFQLASRHGTLMTGFAGYTVPVFGVLAGAVFFDEPLTLHVIGAMTLILLGMVAARK